MRVKYNAKLKLAPVELFVQNNELEVISVNDKYVSIGDKEFTGNLDEAIILHPEFSCKLMVELKRKYKDAEIYTWRYVDLLNHNKTDLKKMDDLKKKYK